MDSATKTGFLRKSASVGTFARAAGLPRPGAAMPYDPYLDVKRPSSSGIKRQHAICLAPSPSLAPAGWKLMDTCTVPNGSMRKAGSTAQKSEIYTPLARRSHVVKTPIGGMKAEPVEQVASTIFALQRSRRLPPSISASNLHSVRQPYQSSVPTYTGQAGPMRLQTGFIDPPRTMSSSRSVSPLSHIPDGPRTPDEIFGSSSRALKWDHCQKMPSPMPKVWLEPIKKEESRRRLNF